jgi:ubiquinone/menaquinone biosynthesis C-methylase UbiE
MKTTEYNTLSDLEDTYWWHVGRLALIEEIIRNSLNEKVPSNNTNKKLLLNIGSGTGGTVNLLTRFGHVINTEISLDALQMSVKKGAELLVCANGTKLPFSDNTFNLAVSLDVLEHIEDDFQALLEWHRVLKPNGKIFITVPAYQWLWSEHDESLMHYRRYNASSLHRLLNKAGFEVERRTYAISFLLPLIVGYRLLRSLVPKKTVSTSYVMVPRIINSFFISLLKFEAVLLKLINLPFGTSVICVGIKKA